MKLFALERRTDFRRHYIGLGTLAVAVLAIDLTLIETMPVGGYEAGLFTLLIGVGFGGLIIWHALITSPFRHIETSLDAAQVQQACDFAQACPLNRRELSQAVTAYLRVKQQPKATNGLTPSMQPQEADYEPARSIV